MKHWHRAQNSFIFVHCYFKMGSQVCILSFSVIVFPLKIQSFSSYTNILTYRFIFQVHSPLKDASRRVEPRSIEHQTRSRSWLTIPHFGSLFYKNIFPFLLLSFSHFPFSPRYFNSREHFPGTCNFFPRLNIGIILSFHLHRSIWVNQLSRVLAEV